MIAAVSTNTKNFLYKVCIGILSISPLVSDEMPEAPFIEHAVEETKTYCYFHPPEEWELVAPDQLSPQVTVAFLGKSKKGFFPSINLAIEEINVNEKDYIKAVKKLHSADRNNRWRELGRVQTKAGIARLTEIDTKCELGPLRLLQMILVKDHKAYILTAAALKEEFSDHYQRIQQAFRSFTLTNNLFSEITEEEKKAELVRRQEVLVSSWKQKFLNAQTSEKPISLLDVSFQQEEWFPLQTYVLEEFKSLGQHWQLLVLKEMQEDLMHVASLLAKDDIDKIPPNSL